ncbi:MAG: hypothetical protein GY810_27580 [Aureispira sp.]|nr:hypothetical protein [Aureispira sp.]
MITKAYKIPLKPNVIEKVRAWAKELNSRPQECMESLEEEGIYLETVFLDQTSIGDYLIYILKMQDEEKAHQVAQQSTRTIDAFHQQFKKECWAGPGQPLEPLIDLDRMSEFFKT